jgi:hypothetical protein
VIVTDPPYDLVALFADAEMQQFVERVIERGQQRKCLRSFRWRSLRDPRRDPMCHRPHAVLQPYLAGTARLLLLWDHEGSGWERRSPPEAESEVGRLLAQNGVGQERILAIAFQPEFEAALVPAWPAVKTVLARRRDVPAPSDEQVLDFAQSRSPDPAGSTFAECLAQRPKELLHAVTRRLGLRVSPALFGWLAHDLSIPALKVPGSCFARLAGQLVAWFPPGLDPRTTAC